MFAPVTALLTRRIRSQSTKQLREKGALRSVPWYLLAGQTAQRVDH
jgi:uncharacterized membrane protein YadS